MPNNWCAPPSRNDVSHLFHLEFADCRFNSLEFFTPSFRALFTLRDAGLSLSPGDCFPELSAFAVRESLYVSGCTRSGSGGLNGNHALLRVGLPLLQAEAPPPRIEKVAWLSDSLLYTCQLPDYWVQVEEATGKQNWLRVFSYAGDVLWTLPEDLEVFQDEESRVWRKSDNCYVDHVVAVPPSSDLPMGGFDAWFTSYGGAKIVPAPLPASPAIYDYLQWPCRCKQRSRWR